MLLANLSGIYNIVMQSRLLVVWVQPKQNRVAVAVNCNESSLVTSCDFLVQEQINGMELLSRMVDK